MNEIRQIFESITECYEIPIRIGSRCEANVYYRVENLSEEDIAICTSYLADRIINACLPNPPDLLINIPGNVTSFTRKLAYELGSNGEAIEVVNLDYLQSTHSKGTNGKSAPLKNACVVLSNEVITTARSCLEAHSRTTLLGAKVMCWAALIDRTFGPGPVPVVASFTGEPVRLLEGLP